MIDFKVGDMVKFVYQDSDLDCRVTGIYADLDNVIGIQVIKIHAKPVGSPISCGSCWRINLDVDIGAITLLTDIDDFPTDLGKARPTEPAHIAGLDREEIDRAAYDDFMRCL